MPTFSTRYIDEAEKMMPRIVPISTLEIVNSGTVALLAGTNGLNATSCDSSRVFDWFSHDPAFNLKPGTMYLKWRM